MPRASLLCASLLVVGGCLDPVESERDAGFDAGRDASVDGSADVGPDANQADGGVDSGLDAAPPDAGPVCWNAVPSRLEVDEVENQIRLYALRNIVLDQRDSWRSIGWDLDRLCTESAASASCLPPDEAEPPPDGDLGSDNAFGRNVLPILLEAFPNLEMEARRRMTESEPLLMRISDYNLTEDDPNCEITVAPTLRPAGLDGRTESQWDGADFWVRNSEGINSGMEPILQDKNAYVRDGIFVMRIPDRQPIPLPWVDGRRVTLRLLGGVMTGRLGQFGTEMHTSIDDVIIQGRLLMVDLETMLDEAGICDDPLRSRILDEARRSMDVDGVSPRPTCGAISIALRLDGYRASRSAIEDPAPPPPACGE